MSDRRLKAEDLAVVSRIYAREAAHAVVSEGMQLLSGAGELSGQELEELERGLGMSEINRAQAGLIRDQDHLADVIYDRC